MSHGVADGASVAQFLLSWAMVSCGGTRLPLAPFSRAVITAPEQQQEEGGESSSDPRTFVQVGLMGRLSVAASALWNEYTYTNCSLFFSAAELEALKQRCMAPLQGADLHSYDKALDRAGKLRHGSCALAILLLLEQGRRCS